jgi:hypothetical protein
MLSAMAATTEPSTLDQQTDRLRAAFDTWTRAQSEAIDRMIESSAPVNAENRAEGFRWITRLASLAQEWFIEKAVDPVHPVLFRCQDEYRKLMVDNPDVAYWYTVLSDEQSYRIWGRRGDAAYIGFTFGSPMFQGQGKGADGLGTLAQSHLDALTVGPDGEFSFIVSPTRPEGYEGDWIEMVPGIGQLAVRETFFHRETERFSEWHIELLGEVPPPRAEPDWMAERIELASLFVAFVAATCHNMWNDAASNMNRFSGQSGKAHVESREDEVRSHSSADMEYHGGRFRLSEDQGLLVTVTAPEEFIYWGLTITNPWMESFDYRYRQTHLNCATAERSDDGTWKMIIAARDPGVPNWIDTGGQLEGYQLVRWCLAPGARPPVAELIDLP